MQNGRMTIRNRARWASRRFLESLFGHDREMNESALYGTCNHFIH